MARTRHGRHRLSRTLLLGLLLGIMSGHGCLTLRRDPDPDIIYRDARRTIDGQPRREAGGVPPAPYNDEDGPEKTQGLRVSDFAPKNLGKTFQKLTGRGPNRAVARELYQKADYQFRRATEAREQRQPSSEYFTMTANTFRQAASRWPDSALEQDALFMAGESYFFADQYPKCTHQFELLIKKYPNTRHLDTVSVRRFAIAQFWLDKHRADPQALVAYNFTDATRPKRGTFSQAVRVLDKIRLDDPTGKLADDATMAAGIAYFEAGKYLDSGDFFEDLIRTFPNSEHQFTAHLLAVKSKLESYQGPAYDADPLERAEKLLSQIRKQFPRDAEQHGEYLRRAFAEARFLRAEREMSFARYYDRRQEYGAARMHYDALINDYADTPFGQQAYERLAQISDEPAKPPQRLGWLIRLLPESKEAKPLIPAGQTGPILR